MANTGKCVKDVDMTERTPGVYLLTSVSPNGSVDAPPRQQLRVGLQLESRRQLSSEREAAELSDSGWSLRRARILSPKIYARVKRKQP